MNQEFETFRIKVLSSLNPNIPLQDNLRAVMAPVLQKLRIHSGAKIAMHVFSNPDVKELHVLMVGGSVETQQALNTETKRRNELLCNIPPGLALPQYVAIAKEQALFPNVSPEREEIRPLNGELFALMETLKKMDCFKNEFCGHSPVLGDLTLVIPLTRQQFQRLGYIVLWSHRESLKDYIKDPIAQEDRILFRQSIADMMIRIFGNFYHMGPATYLPSYYRAEEKCVTLLCAEIHGTDRLSEKLEASNRLGTLRNLLNQFCEVAAREVEVNRGRVDQIWGNGLVAVFGEHLDTADVQYEKTGLKRALTTAADLVIKTRKVAETWIQKEFDHDSGVDHITVLPAVAIDHAKVFFDYVGSQERRVYMAVGDRVSFVKRLANLSGQVASTARGLDANQVVLNRSVNPSNTCWDVEFEGAPILLTRTAHFLADDYLETMKGQTREALHAPHFVNMAGRVQGFPVFAVWPENLAHIRRPTKV